MALGAFFVGGLFGVGLYSLDFGINLKGTPMYLMVLNFIILIVAVQTSGQDKKSSHLLEVSLAFFIIPVIFLTVFWLMYFVIKNNIYFNFTDYFVIKNILVIAMLTISTFLGLAAILESRFDNKEPKD